MEITSFPLCDACLIFVATAWAWQFIPKGAVGLLRSQAHRTLPQTGFLGGQCLFHTLSSEGGAVGPSLSITPDCLFSWPILVGAHAAARGLAGNSVIMIWRVNTRKYLTIRKSGACGCYYFGYQCGHRLSNYKVQCGSIISSAPDIQNKGRPSVY